MKPKSTLRSFLFLAGSSLLAATSLHASSLYWSADGSTQGGAGTWNTSTSNWGTVASGPFSSAWNNINNDTAIFGGATAGAVPLGEPITVGGLQFDTAGYTISSDTLTFGAAGNIAVNTASTTGVTISSILAGSVAVQKTGTGDLTLSGNNTYTGALTLNGGRTFANTSVNALGTGAASLVLTSGTLVLNHSANLNFARPTTVTGDSQINSSKNAAGAGVSYTLGTLAIGANTLTVGAGVTTSGTAALTFGATTLSGNATFNVVNGAGSTTQLTLGLVGDGGSGFGITKTSGGILALGSANTYSGPTIISAGILDATTFANINTNSSIGKGSVGGSAADLVLNGGTLRHSAANAASTNRLFSVGTGGGIIQSTHATAGNFLKFIGTGAMDFNGQTGARTLTLDGANTGDNTVALLIGDNSGATSLSKTGAGTWLLTNANTYTGGTTVSAGTLVLDFTGGNDRIKNTNQVVLAGGTMQLRNLGTNTQTLAATSITTAGSRITQGTGYTSGVSDLGTLSASGSGSLDVSNLAVGTTWIKASGNPSQPFLLNGRVTANTGAFLVKTDASGNLQTVATTDYVSDASISDSPGTSVRLISTGGTGGGSTGSGFIGLSTAGTTNFESLQNNYTTGTTTIDVTNSGVNTGNILRLGAAGVITSSSGAALTIGTTVANGGVLTAGGADNTAGTLYFNHSNNITVNSAINDNGTGVVSLNKTGAGTLTLNGNNSFTGNVTVNGGTLVLFNNNDCSDITVNGSTLTSGGTDVGPGTLGADGGTITFTGTSFYNPQRTSSQAVLTYAKNVAVNSGTTTFQMSTQYYKEAFSGVLSGSGTIVKNDGNSTLTFSNASNSFTGLIRLDSGSGGMAVNSLADSANPIQFNGNTGAFSLSGAAATATSLLFDSRQIVLAASGAISNNNSSSTKTITINTDLGFSGTGTRTLTLGGTNTGVNTFGGDIGNNGGSAVSLTKTDGGTWALSGTNTYTGNTNLSAVSTTGRLVFQGSQSLSPGTKLVFAQNSSFVQSARFLDDGAGTINFNRPIEFGGTNTTQGLSIFVGNNHTDNLGSNASSSTTGSTIQVGDVTFTSVATDTNTTTINATGANGYRLRTGTITLNNLQTRTAGQTTVTALNPTTANMTVDAITMATGNAGPGADGIPTLRLTGTSTDNRVTGAITEAEVALPVQKQGAGTWTLSGTNLYTGATAITAGTLLVNGSLHASSAVSVATTGTLGGTGTINGSVTVAAAGNVAPGASVGTLSIGGNLDISAMAGGAGLLNYELGTNTATSDKIAVTGTLTIGIGTLGYSNFAFSNAGGLQNGTYTLITSGGINVGDSLDGADLSGSIGIGGTGTLQINGNNIELVVSGLGGGPGPLDHFAISAIASPQTVGTPITGITLTAQDAANATVTSFTGTVNFGGTGGFTGTSGTFTLGVLSGVSVTPTNAGSGLTLTVTDIGSGKTGLATITTIQTQYAAWAGGAAFDADANGDGVKNGLAFLLGAANPSASALSLLPVVTQSGGNLTLTFNCLKAANRGSASLNVEHSSNLGISDPWTAVAVPESSGGPTSGVTFTVTAGGGSTNGVVATISSSEAASGKLFGRLKSNP